MQPNDIPQSLSLTRARAGMPKPSSGAQSQRADAFSAILAAVPQLDANADDQTSRTDGHDDADRFDRPSDQQESPQAVSGLASDMSLGLQVPVMKSLSASEGAARNESGTISGLAATNPEATGVGTKLPTSAPSTHASVSVPSHSGLSDPDQSTGETSAQLGNVGLLRRTVNGEEASLMTGLSTDRGTAEGTTRVGQLAFSRGASGLGNPIARAGLLQPHGRGADHDTARHGGAAGSLRLDSTAALQSDLARAQANHFGTPQLANSLAASFDRRGIDRSIGEAGVSKLSNTAEPSLSWKLSAPEGGSWSTLGTAATSELGVGLIPGIAGRLADSLDEVSDRLNQSGRATRSTEAANLLSADLGGLPGSATTGAVTIAPRLGSPDWSGAFAQAVVQVAADQLTEASLTISPPELGTIEIELELHGEEMHIAFLSDNAEVRDSVESGLPALSQLLEKQGLSLGSADIRGNDHPSQGTGGETGARPEGRPVSPVSGSVTQPAGAAHEASARTSRSTQRVVDGRVDLYA